MDQEELRRLDALLAERQAEARSEAVRLDEALAELLLARGDGTADDEHDPEGTPLSAEWSRMAGVRDALTRSERELADARRRVGQGAYGDCLRCDRPIGAERLAARPTAELCIDCARLAERVR